jgi:broad specificity phosphatase PhoE
MLNDVTRWWWIRHAPVTSNDGRIYGQKDLLADCSDDGAFATLAKILPSGAVLATSDLQRTTQTADAIKTAGLDLPEAIIEPAFREQCFGEWQGMRYQEFASLRDDLAHRHWLSPAFERPPLGESFADVIARVVPAVISITAAYAGRDVVAVAHGGTIRAAAALALGLDPEAVLALSIDNLSVTRLDHIDDDENGAAWRVVTVNRPSR